MKYLHSKLDRSRAITFMENLIQEARNFGFSLSGDKIDHFCFRTSTSESYYIACQQIANSETGNLKGKLLSEAVVNGRKISTFKLEKAIELKEFKVDVLEIPHPKDGVQYDEDFEHIEVVVHKPLQQLVENHPSIQWDLAGLGAVLNSEISFRLNSGKIKFHNMSLEKVIEIEEKQTIGTTIFDYQPILADEQYMIRPLVLSDFESFFAAAGDPEIWRQHSDPERYKPNNFKKFFEKAFESPGSLVVIDKKDNQVIGGTRFYDFDEGSRTVFAGYSFLMKKYWGGKTNFAIKRLILNHAFKYVDRVIFQTSPQNERSRRALAKLGATEVAGIVDIQGLGQRVEYYITKDFWIKKSPSNC